MFRPQPLLQLPCTGALRLGALETRPDYHTKFQDVAARRRSKVSHKTA